MVRQNRYERPLFVIYDITSNKIRKKVFEACEDFGLLSVQFSAFFGFLDSTKKKELLHRIKTIIGKEEGNFIFIPLEKNQLKKIVSKGNALGITQTPMIKFL
ncbi:MAG: CRISPR-associated endonuclease Cas2 [Spirochaetota bacterium]|nr:CRISPR-associated endonuclease Cas2 [Spirochaetota bacterium]